LAKYEDCFSAKNDWFFFWNWVRSGSRSMVFMEITVSSANVLIVQRQGSVLHRMEMAEGHGSETAKVQMTMSLQAA